MKKKKVKKCVLFIFVVFAALLAGYCIISTCIEVRDQIEQEETEYIEGIYLKY